MFGTAQADTFGAELDCHSCIMRRIRIGADAQFAVFICQRHDVAKRSGQLRIHRVDFTGVNRSGGTVQADPVAFFDSDAVDDHLAGFVVDIDFAATGYTAGTHTTGNYGSVAGHTAPGSENTLCYMHAADIFGAGFDTAEDHGFAVLAPSFGIFGRKYRHTGSGTGAGGQADSKFLSFAFGTLDEHRMQKLVKLGRFHPQYSGLFVDQTFFNKVGGDFYCGSSGAFAVTGLEHEEFTVFDGKFHILHIFIMLFQLDADVVQLLETFGHGFFQRRIFSFTDIFRNVLTLCPDFAARQRDLLGRADTGNHVFALSVDEKFAVEIFVFAGGWVTGKCHAGSGIVAGVAENQCLNINRCTDQAPDVVDFPVADGTGIIPGFKHSLDTPVELIHRVGGEIAAGSFFDDFFVCGNKFFKVIGSQFVIQFDLAGFFQGFQSVFKQIRINVHNYIAEHLDKSAEAVQHKAFIAGKVDQCLYGNIVQTQIEHGIHHTGHGGSRSAANGYQQRVGAFAEGFAQFLFQFCQCGIHLRCDLGKEFLFADLAEFGAGFSGDGKSGRYRQSQCRHTGEVRTLTPEQSAHSFVAFRIVSAKVINILDGRCGSFFASHDPLPFFLLRIFDFFPNASVLTEF